jgi:predicted dehydrogenase
MKEYKVVIAGCGGMANVWVKYALNHENVEIVGLVDIKEENAKRLAAYYKLSCPIFKEVTTAIKASKANLVFNITTPQAHHEIAVKPLYAGCNVFGEKPMATSIG